MGGRGSSGKSKSGGGAGGGASGPSNFPAGTYVDEDGEEYSVGYKRSGEGTRITQYVDGKDTGNYRYYNPDLKGYVSYRDGQLVSGYSKTAKEADELAFGSSKSFGWTKKSKKRKK